MVDGNGRASTSRYWTSGRSSRRRSDCECLRAMTHRQRALAGNNSLSSNGANDDSSRRLGKPRRNLMIHTRGAYEQNLVSLRSRKAKSRCRVAKSPSFGVILTDFRCSAWWCKMTNVVWLFPGGNLNHPFFVFLSMMPRTGPEIQIQEIEEAEDNPGRVRGRTS